MAAWRTLVNDTVARLEGELAGLTAAMSSRPEHAQIVQHLQEARDSAAGSSWNPLHWWNGDPIENAWFHLHAAAQDLVLLQDEAAVLAQLPEIRASLASSLTKSDPRLGTYIDKLKKIEKAATLDKATRLDVRAMLRTAHDNSDQAHGVLRTYRNQLLMVSALLTVLLLTVGIVHAAQPKLFSVCASPTKTEVASTTTPADQTLAVDEDGQVIGAAVPDDTDRCPNGTSDPAGSDVFQILLLGALGGAGAAIARAVRSKPSRNPYGLQVVQTLVKLPAGAATALIGVLLMQHQVAGFLTPQTGSHLVGFAVLFGFAQEGATRLIDQQAAKVLDATSSKNDPDTSSEPGSDSSSEAS